MKLMRIVLLLLCTVAAGVARAQPWPNKPVRVIIPFPPGAGAENAARLVGNHWARTLGQAFVIESRPGGNTMRGAEAAAKSAPDGYTLFLCAASTMVVTPALMGAKAPDRVLRQACGRDIRLDIGDEPVLVGLVDEVLQYAAHRRPTRWSFLR